MSSIHELLKQVYPLNLRMELFNAIWTGWRADIKEKDQQITDLQNQLAITEKALEFACGEITGSCEYCSYKTMIECPIEANCLDEKINYFKTKAKEMLENE